MVMQSAKIRRTQQGVRNKYYSLDHALASGECRIRFLTNNSSSGVTSSHLYIPTPVIIAPEFWDKRNKIVLPPHPKAIEFNKELDLYHDLILDAIKEGKNQDEIRELLEIKSTRPVKRTLRTPGFTRGVGLGVDGQRIEEEQEILESSLYKFPTHSSDFPLVLSDEKIDSPQVSAFEENLKMGRKSFTLEQRLRVIELFYQGNSIPKIRKATRIGRATIRKWILQERKLNPESIKAIHLNSKYESKYTEIWNLHTSGISFRNISEKVQVPLGSLYYIINHLREMNTPQDSPIINEPKQEPKTIPTIQAKYKVGEIEYADKAEASQAAFTLMQDSGFPVTIYELQYVAVATINPIG